MTNITKAISILCFALGAIVVLWMGSSFIGSNLLALLVTVLIAGAYTVGFSELMRYQTATASLEAALLQSREGIASLEQWLSKLHPSLQHAVHQRIQGEHLGLPAPVLTPYLVGLLVMLGLLGTFIGMVATLQGAVSALEGSTELAAVRAGLAAPIQGLGMAFATSVAGVTASAMLGLISTLSRRQRLASSRQLDAEMSGAFKAYSLSHQRRQTYQALQQQAEALPAVAGKLEDLAQKLAEMTGSLGENLSDRQQRFQEGMTQGFTQLAESVDGSLKQSLADSGKLAGESMQPVLAQFLDTLAKQQHEEQQRLNSAVADQVTTMTTAFSETSSAVSSAWERGLKHHHAANTELAETLAKNFVVLQEQFSETGGSLLNDFSAASQEWLAQQHVHGQSQQENWQRSLDEAATLLRGTAEEIAVNGRRNATEASQQINALLAQSEALISAREGSEAVWLDAQQSRFEALQATMSSQLDKLRDTEQQRNDSSAAKLLELISRSEDLLQARENGEQQWQQDQQQRFDTLMSTFAEQLSALRDEESRRGAAAASQLDKLQDIAALRLAELGTALEQPMRALIETASETPKAAAEVITKLRSEISNNIERDNALLEERQQLMAQLNKLSASLEANAQTQSSAVQALLDRSAEQLGEVNQQFAKQVDDESNKLVSLVDYFAASSTELASLGGVFTTAVEQFSDSNQKMMAQFSQLEKGLNKATSRSDEQMEYYLLQAREIIDHNLLSQQELLEQLKESAGRKAHDGKA